MIKFKRFFLAEDDTDDYLLFAEALTKISHFHSITRAANGLECLTLLKNADTLPQLIFLDLNMPIKNGVECLCSLKDNDVLKHIPVIIYSTSHYIRDIDAAYKNGAHYYIVKPSSADMLVDVLHTVFSRLETTGGQPAKESFVVRIAATLES